MNFVSRISLAVGVVSTLACVPASAVTYQYTYTGRTLVTTDPFGQAGSPEFLPAYNGIMKIDEAALPGGTLANATVTFRADYIPPLYVSGPPYSDAPGLVDFTVFPFPAIASSQITFTTDSLRRITSWNGFFLDGPPDGGISNVRGDDYLTTGPIDLTYRAPPGTWSDPQAIPLPVPALMLLSGLLGLIMVGRRVRIA